MVKIMEIIVAMAVVKIHWAALFSLLQEGKFMFHFNQIRIKFSSQLLRTIIRYDMILYHLDVAIDLG